MQWLIEDRLENAHIGYRAIVDADGCTVCNPSPMGEANARLIAAAPDLLDVLCRALPYVEDAIDDPCYKPESVRAAVKQIRAAIERATIQE
jgi:protein-tyrosine-phosphatase